MIRRLLAQSSHNTIGTLLVTLASVVSFPIFTRTFTVAEYGTLNLIASLLLFWVSLGKLGMQQSITRLLGEAAAHDRGHDAAGFLVTVLLGMAATGLAATLAAALASVVLPQAWWNDAATAHLLLPVSALIVVRVLDSAINNILRAQQRTILLNAYAVVRRYVSLVVVLALVLWLLPGLEGFYLGTFVVEALAVAVMIAVVLRGQAGGARFSPASFRAMLAFGIPLIAYEISGIVLNLGDRYVVQAMLGAEPLGQYSAAYNLCDYVRMVVLLSIAQSVTPISVDLWERQGEEACRRFIERALRVYLMVSLPVIAGTAAVGETLLTTLASDKYQAGAATIPWIIAGTCIDAGAAIFGAGMYIHKANRRFVPWVVGAAVLNIVLNVALIPSLGIQGSAIATFVSYAVIAASAWMIGARYMKVAFPVADLLKYAALAAVMYVVVREIHAPSRVAELALRVVAGASLYGAMLLVVDRQAREALSVARARFLPGAAR